MSALSLDSAREWLASSQRDIAHAYRWWEHGPDGVAIMRLGCAFDAVEIPAPLSSRLLPHPNVTGPAFAYADTRELYVLVPAGTSDSWSHPTTLCLGDGHYLDIPDPGRLGPDGAYWVQQPDGSGQLTRPESLAAALAEAESWLGACDPPAERT